LGKKRKEGGEGRKAVGREKRMCMPILILLRKPGQEERGNDWGLKKNIYKKERGGQTILRGNEIDLNSRINAVSGGCRNRREEREAARKGKALALYLEEKGAGRSYRVFW